MSDTEQMEAARQFTNKWRSGRDEKQDRHPFWIGLIRNVLGVENAKDYIFYEKEFSMKKKIWDIYAPVYKKAMKADERAYAQMYRRIPKVIKNKDVLEIATGPGLLALHVAPAAKTMVATDYSEGMIREAEKNKHPDNLRFEIADATKLPYEAASFDVVIIANALHVMPDPEKAMDEIHRVLRPQGILIAPNFVNHGKGFVSRVWSGVLRAAGISFDHQWSEDEYLAFLENHGWKVVNYMLMKARIPMMYTECVEKKCRFGVRCP